MRWQLASTFAALAMSGCYEESTIPCDNGVLCPSTLTCTENDPASGALLCAESDDLTACSDSMERDSCSSPLTGNGLCIDRVCEPCENPAVFECRYDAWTVVPSPAVPGLFSVWVQAPNRAHAVGNNGVVLEYDGASWEQIHQVGPVLGGVWALGADTYAAGEDGTVYRNGLAMTGTTTKRVRGIWGAAANDIVAVGNQRTLGIFRGASWMWTDGGVTELVAYRDVYGMGDEAFIVGDQGTVLHRATSAASFEPFAQPSTTDELNAIWGTSPTDFYVVGALNANLQTGVVHHYTVAGGVGTWTTEPLPMDVPALAGVWGPSDGSIVYAVGYEGVTLRRSNGNWEKMNVPIADTQNFTDLSGGAVDGIAHAIAVAGNGAIVRLSPR